MTILLLCACGFWRKKKEVFNGNNRIYSINKNSLNVNQTNALCVIDSNGGKTKTTCGVTSLVLKCVDGIAKMSGFFISSSQSSLFVGGG